jgi:hypothetical protein
VPGVFDNQQAVDNKLKGGIKNFARTYFHVRSMLENLHQARVRIDNARLWLDILVKHVNDQQVLYPPANAGVTLTRCANLETLREGVTWLYSLRAVLVGDLHEDQVVRKFKDVVVWGSQGLTRQGLRHVMSMSQESTHQAIVSELHARCGRMKLDIKTDVEAPWWQGNHFNVPDQTRQNFWYRIFPDLPPEEYQALLKEAGNLADSGQQVPKYIPAKDSYAGLRILAVECSRTREELMPDDKLSELVMSLLPNIKPTANDKTVKDYIRRLSGSSTGEPLYVNEFIANSISPNVDIRDYFLTID